MDILPHKSNDISSQDAKSVSAVGQPALRKGAVKYDFSLPYLSNYKN